MADAARGRNANGYVKILLSAEGGAPLTRLLVVAFGGTSGYGMMGPSSL